MKSSKFITPLALLTASLFIAGTTKSSAVIILLSDLVPASPTETGVLVPFLNASFGNVTEIRHGNFANFNAATTQDALNGTGAYAGMGAADMVIIGRSLGSADYDAGDSTGYNALTIPMVSLTSYVARQDGTRLGWHASGATGDKLVAGDETTVTLSGASILGLAAGTYNLSENLPLPASQNFNGLGALSDAATYGGADILATVGGDTLAAYWAPGSAPGNVGIAGVATFPAARLLFNLNNDPNPATPTTAGYGANDLANLTPQGKQALVNAIAFATPLNVIPEPSSILLGFTGLGLLARRRR